MAKKIPRSRTASAKVAKKAIKRVSQVRSRNAVHESPEKRQYLKQADVPAASLDEALRVPAAILEHYAGKPVSPLQLAKALNVDPKGSQLKLLSGAAIAFGLTDGGSQAATITVSELAKKILRPKSEDAPMGARRQAILTPRVFREFLEAYDGHSFPREDIAVNVLEEMGVPRIKASEVLARIESSARSVGIIEEIKGKAFVSLQTISSVSTSEQEILEDIPFNEKLSVERVEREYAPYNGLESGKSPSSMMATAIADDARRRRVFITHGKNRELVEPIRKMLEYGEMTPVISVDRQSVSKPVPEKVMDDMRSCGAAIIHVDADRTITAQDGEAHVVLNPNVLIEIGAAMAFYGRRFILLVRDGVKLPSNLQGLYEVRYVDDKLDAHAAIKLLEAIKDIKNYALPTDPEE
ncbi:TIR domain-containing protein [Xanthomonas bonasiae]|uniref:TIR domain-containing protein n=1 Tax=Xanthomonas bonasiae TaxID=2810351 RepID=UPI00177E7026|nr:TIR domain-containing protein [Xanthomonas surreyensis]MBD7923727.1 nucleotide-binding protein [Xanthomonas surreyensis]